MTKVTICIPTFNSEETIAETLESLKKQTFKGFDVVIFDNCSTDNTINIVSGFNSDFKALKIITSEENIGAEANFTRCLNYTSEGYVAIYHADDIYHPEIIEEQVNALETLDIVAVSTHALRIDIQGGVLGERFIPKELRKEEKSVLSKEEFVHLIFKYGNFVTCPSVMAKAEVYYHKIKNWNGADYKTSADLDVWVRCASFGNFCFLRRPLISYREAHVSTSFRLKQKRTHRHDMFLVLERLLCDAKPDELKFYEFLYQKDLALRAYNGASKTSLEKPFLPCAVDVFKVAFESRWHFTFYLKVLGIWATFSFKRFFA